MPNFWWPPSKAWDTIKQLWNYLLYQDAGPPEKKKENE